VLEAGEDGMGSGGSVACGTEIGVLLPGCPDPDLPLGCKNQIRATVTTRTPMTAATAVSTSPRLRGGR
jgi:hypothetical protein